MPYEVVFTAAAAKAVKKLERSIIDRIRPRVLALADDPRPTGSMKLSGQEGLYRIRAGDYRVVYHVDDAGRVITVTIVAHPRESYRDL